MNNTLKVIVLNVMMCAWMTVALSADKAAPRADQKLGDGPSIVALEPETAGPDFAIQGEYSTADKKHGAQVVALGFGHFHLVWLNGGLPGDGWDGKEPFEVDGKTEGAATVFQAKESTFKGVITGSMLQVMTTANEPLTLQKVMRESPTSGAKPPPGAIVLFDGTNMDAWETGVMDERKLIKASTQKGTGHSAGPTTKQKFKDFILHVELREPFTPSARGQGRGNSGVYLQNRYEIQVLDSFGMRLGKTAAVGDVCGEVYKKVTPTINMSYPPLSWQTFDVDYVAARFDEQGKKVKNALVTIKHNGVLTIDQKEIDGNTGPLGDAATAAPGALMLQDHGYPVYFRNIWIIEKK